MVSYELIQKSLEEAIIKCRPNFASMRTVKQIAKYFHLKYDGLISNEDISDNYNAHYTEGKIHSFTDPNNDNCRIFVFDDLIEKETGLLKSEWYQEEFEIQEKENNWTDEERREIIETSTYPLKQFIKDYSELPYEFKSSIGELTFHYKSNHSNASMSGLSGEGNENKSTIQMYSNSIDQVGFTGVIQSNPRMDFFHEVGHSISRKLGYDSKEGAFWDYNPDYLAQTKDYKNGRKEDKKLNGDKYATEYGRSSKDFSEEQADVTMAMLLKALSKNDSDYDKYKMALASAYNQGVYESEDYLNVDDFLKRYPNRVSALNKYLGLDI